MDILEIRNALAAGTAISALPLRVAYYARVSTDKTEQQTSLHHQREYYENNISANPNWTFAGGFVDEGISGGSVEGRKQFLAMLSAAEKGKVDYILTKEISRFSRDTLDSIHYTRKLLQLGVGVYFESDNINTLMPDAELRLTIMASLAQDERRRLSERVRFGFRRSIEEGRVLGNNNIWGYEKVNGALRIVPDEAEVVKRIFTLYAAGNIGIRALSEQLEKEGYRNRNGGRFSTSTVTNILQNPKYKGTYCGGKTCKLDYRSKAVKKLPKQLWKLESEHAAVPPIVPEPLWQRANDILARRSGTTHARQERYLYTGRIDCGVHGCPYYRAVVKNKSATREIWRCREYVGKGRRGCSNPGIYTEEADEAVRRFLQSLPVDAQRLAELTVKWLVKCGSSASLKQGRPELEKKRYRALAAKDRLIQLFAEGHITTEEFTSRKEKYINEADKAASALEKLEKQPDGSEQNLYAAVLELLSFQGSINRLLLDTLDIRLTVYGEEHGDVCAPVAKTMAVHRFCIAGKFFSVWCGSDT